MAVTRRVVHIPSACHQSLATLWTEQHVAGSGGSHTGCMCGRAVPACHWDGVCELPRPYVLPRQRCPWHAAALPCTHVLPRRDGSSGRVVTSRPARRAAACRGTAAALVATAERRRGGRRCHYHVIFSRDGRHAVCDCVSEHHMQWGQWVRVRHSVIAGRGAVPGVRVGVQQQGRCRATTLWPSCDGVRRARRTCWRDGNCERLERDS